jgi:hypothetical protein
MAGLNLNMGLGGQAAAAGYTSAGVPAAAQTPTGPRTIGQQAFGVVSGAQDDSGGAPFYAVILGGGGALALLAFIWWSLPR